MLKFDDVVDCADVAWVCEKCGYKWSNCCIFKDGVLTAVDVGEEE
jgi:hypothetical protein